jgi:hypothetical protein
MVDTSSRHQIETEAAIMQYVWNAQAELKAALEVNDHCDPTLRAGASFVTEAFSGGLILSAVQAVKELETALMDAKFEKIGEAAYFPQETAKQRQ